MKPDTEKRRDGLALSIVYELNRRQLIRWEPDAPLEVRNAQVRKAQAIVKAVLERRDI